MHYILARTRAIEMLSHAYGMIYDYEVKLGV